MLKMINKNLKNNVSVVRTVTQYPVFPYDVDSEIKQALLDVFSGMGLSRENPFSTYISPGQSVLIKPNWVRDRNPLGFDIESLITHPSIIKYVLDFLAIAMEGKGKIIIADAPLQNCNFENLKKNIRLDEIVETFNKQNPSIELIVEDWRITTIPNSKLNIRDIQKFRITDNEDIKKEYNIIDMAENSFLEDISEYSNRFRVTKYKPSLMQDHHRPGKHEYLVTKRIHDVDFFINIPKLKTHIKAGLTCSMKNLVGINGHKEFLPHHIKGSYFDGGDNYSSSSWFKTKYENLYDYLWENVNQLSVIKRKFIMKALDYLLLVSRLTGSENITAGSWRGNDTIWRTTLDLNHIAYFCSNKPLKILNIVDGIIAGEGQGPLEPSPKPLGILIAGENPAYVDAVVARIIGFNISRIPTVYNAIYHRKSKFAGEYLEDFKIQYNDGKSEEISLSSVPSFNFKKPLFWEGA